MNTRETGKRKEERRADLRRADIAQCADIGDELGALQHEARSASLNDGHSAAGVQNNRGRLEQLVARQHLGMMREEQVEHDGVPEGQHVDAQKSDAEVGELDHADVLCWIRGRFQHRLLFLARSVDDHHRDDDGEGG